MSSRVTGYCRKSYEAIQIAKVYKGILPKYLEKILGLLSIYNDEYYNKLIVAFMIAISPMKDDLLMVKPEVIEYKSKIPVSAVNMFIALTYIECNKIEHIVPHSILALGLELFRTTDIDCYAEFISTLDLKIKDTVTS